MGSWDPLEPCLIMVLLDRGLNGVAHFTDGGCAQQAGPLAGLLDFRSQSSGKGLKEPLIRLLFSFLLRCERPTTNNLCDRRQHNIASPTFSSACAPRLRPASPTEPPPPSTGVGRRCLPSPTFSAASAGVVWGGTDDRRGRGRPGVGGVPPHLRGALLTTCRRGARHPVAPACDCGGGTRRADGVTPPRRRAADVRPRCAHDADARAGNAATEPRWGCFAHADTCAGRSVAGCARRAVANHHGQGASRRRCLPTPITAPASAS